MSFLLACVMGEYNSRTGHCYWGTETETTGSEAITKCVSMGPESMVIGATAKDDLEYNAVVTVVEQM